WLGLLPQKEGGGGGRAPSAATLLVALTQAAGVRTFRDGERCFALVPKGGHAETWPLRSKGFKTWLGRLDYQRLKKAPHAPAVHDALAVLEGAALHDGEQAPTHVRVAGHLGKVYVDLADPAWRAVEVDAAGWRVVADPPVRFRRPGGLLPLPEPARGRSL